MASIPQFDSLMVDDPALLPDRSREIFQARLKKVSSGKAPRHVIWVGAMEAYAMPERGRRGAPRGTVSAARNVLYPLARVMAVALGFVSCGLAQIGRYHLQGLPDPKANPDIEMLVQLVAGFAVAMVLGAFLGLRGRQYSPLKSLGAALGILAFHNLVHAFPQIFARMASPIWVNFIVSHTEPHSLVWRGISFVF